MVKSMTGYGRATETLNKRGITVEVKSVNHRFLDCTVKTPRAYIFLDDPIKSVVSTYISRGKTDIFITVDNSGAENVNVKINESLLRGYMDVFAKLKEEYGIRDDVSVTNIVRIPDMMNVEKQDDDIEELTADVTKVLKVALEGHSEMRIKEGKKLAEDILGRLDLLENMAEQVEIRSPKRVEEYREKLEARMREVLESAMIEPQRILTEAAVFADKVAVDEETVRLRSHIAQFRDMLASGGAIGRKLDFLVQELNREVNTIGSKSNDLEMTAIVVDMKSEIEKIREQVQNIE